MSLIEFKEFLSLFCTIPGTLTVFFFYTMLELPPTHIKKTRSDANIRHDLVM